MKTALLNLITVVSVLLNFQYKAEAQDFSRFLKVNKWKITYSLEINIAQKFVNDTAIFKFMEDLDVRGWALEKSTLKGDLNFDKREDRSTWIGKGIINYNIFSASGGAIEDTDFKGLMKGSGSTKLCSDESWFSIDLDSGTYELYLVPGNGELSGMNVKVCSQNSVWTDFANNMRQKFGKSSDEILTEHLDELIIPDDESEPEDVFDVTDPDRWIVNLESAKLPQKGLIIKGERTSWNNTIYIWTIEPAD